MRRVAAFLAGHFTICGLAFAAAQDLPYPGDPLPGEEMIGKTYVTLRGSLTFDGKGANVTVPTTPAATSLRPSHDVGGGGMVALGAELPYGFRIEAEAQYRRKPVKNVNLGGTITPASGYVETAAPMFNLLWAPDVGTFPVKPVIGGGVGYAYTQSRINDPVGSTTYLQQSGWHLAYQGMAGIEVPIFPGAAFTANYRWMHTDNVAGRCGVAGAATLACTKIGFDDQGVDMGLKIDLN